MKLDPVVIARIHDLAESGKFYRGQCCPSHRHSPMFRLPVVGIVASDVVQDNIDHFVEHELFKGRPPPERDNRRFYPTIRDIRNHVGMVKRAKNVPKTKGVYVPSTE